MSFGVLWVAKRTPYGYGWPFVEEPVGWLPGHSATAACKAHATCERLCRSATGIVPRAATSGMPTPPLSPSTPTVPAARKKGRPTTWSVGLVRCEHGSVVWCAGRTPFPRTPRTTSMPSICLSPPTTLPSNSKQQPVDHHHNSLKLVFFRVCSQAENSGSKRICLRCEIPLCVSSIPGSCHRPCCLGGRNDSMPKETWGYPMRGSTQRK